MIDRETWTLLGDRLAEIALAKLELEAELDDHLELVFDDHDQAHVVSK